MTGIVQMRKGEPMSDLISRQKAIDAIKALEEYAPTAQHLSAIFDCEDTIRDFPSVESERKWIPVTEALPENRNVVLVTVYWHETYQVMQASCFGSDWWCVPFNNCGKHMQKLNPIAWMPLPEVYRGE